MFLGLSFGEFNLFMARVFPTREDSNVSTDTKLRHAQIHVESPESNTHTSTKPTNSKPEERKSLDNSGGSKTSIRIKETSNKMADVAEIENKEFLSPESTQNQWEYFNRRLEGIERAIHNLTEYVKK